MARQWTEEQKQAARERMQAKNEAKKTAEVRERIRIPIGAKRDVLSVDDVPKGYIDRWVNDTPGRIQKFKDAGYEHVESGSDGASGVDSTDSVQGVVSRDVGKGVTAYRMRQRLDYYTEDQAEKQRNVDSTEESMRRKKNETRSDGLSGEVKIGRE